MELSSPGTKVPDTSAFYRIAGWEIGVVICGMTAVTWLTPRPISVIPYFWFHILLSAFRNSAFYPVPSFFGVGGQRSIWLLLYGHTIPVPNCRLIQRNFDLAHFHIKKKVRLLRFCKKLVTRLFVINPFTTRLVTEINNSAAFSRPIGCLNKKAVLSQRWPRDARYIT